MSSTQVVWAEDAKQAVKFVAYSDKNHDFCDEDDEVEALLIKLELLIMVMPVLIGKKQVFLLLA
jgi:hypothetical protein